MSATQKPRFDPNAMTDAPWYYVDGAVWTTPRGAEDGGQCIAMRASESRIPAYQRDNNLRLCSQAPILEARALKAEAERDALREALSSVLDASTSGASLSDGGALLSDDLTDRIRAALAALEVRQ